MDITSHDCGHRSHPSDGKKPILSHAETARALKNCGACEHLLAEKLDSFDIMTVETPVAATTVSKHTPQTPVPRPKSEPQSSFQGENV